MRTLIWMLGLVLVPALAAQQDSILARDSAVRDQLQQEIERRGHRGAPRVSASAARACSKQASGARTVPAPIRAANIPARLRRRVAVPKTA